MDLEGAALEARRRARVGATEILSGEVFAKRLTGLPVMRLPIVSARGMLVTVKGRPQVVVHPLARDRNFVIFHELGHYTLRHVIIGWKGSLAEEELLASRLAMALLAPRELLRSAFAWFGLRHVAPVAKLFGMSQTATILRWAEAEREEHVVVTVNQNVIARSFGGFASAAPSVVRTWAQGRTPKGLRKTRLTGAFDKGRVALSA